MFGLAKVAVITPNIKKMKRKVLQLQLIFWNLSSRS